MSEDSDWVRIVRDFDAPIEEVWKLWATAEGFKQWYGPNGFSVPVAEMDVKIGGTRKICMEMKSPEQTMSMWFTGVFKEVNPVSRLVYTESMCDADGTIIDPASIGMPPGHPDITEVIVDLEDLGGSTRMTMVHRGVPAGTAGEGGWLQAIDKLAVLLGS